MVIRMKQNSRKNLSMMNNLPHIRVHFRSVEKKTGVPAVISRALKQEGACFIFSFGWKTEILTCSFS